MKFLKDRIFANSREVLTANEQKKVVLHLWFSAILSVLDVFSMILIGIVASSIVPVVQSKPQNISSFVAEIFQLAVKLVNLDYKTFFILLIILSFTLLIIKSVIMMRLYKKNQEYLAFISNRFIRDFLKYYFYTPLNYKNNLSKGELVKSFHLGVDSLFYQYLGARIHLLGEVISIIILLVPIVIIFPQILVLLLLIYFATKTKYYKTFLRRAEDLGSETVKSVEKYTDKLMFLSESHSENFNKSSLQDLIENTLSDRVIYSKAKVNKLIAQLMPRFVLENTIIILLIPISLLTWIFLSISSALVLLSFAFIFLIRVVPAISRIVSYLVVLRQHKTEAMEIINQFVLLKSNQNNFDITNRTLRKGFIPLITLDNYELMSPKNKVIMKNVNFEIAGFGIHLIKGQNGSGKSSILKSIVGEIQSTRGNISITVNGSAEDLNDEIRYLPQKTGIYGNSIESNIKMGLSISGAEFQRAISILNLLNFESNKAEKVHFGSGGEMQKVFIARILCRNASIYILDEPTNHLDEKSYRNLAEVLIKKSEKSLILIVSHDSKFTELLPIKSTLKLGS